MPYILRKVNGKHHVYKKGDNGQPVGKPLGKHRTRSGAVDQLRALYANDESAKATKFTDAAWSSPESDLSADDFCSCCLIDENPSGEDKIKAKCWLPIKDTPDSPVNRNALRNAASRLPQVKGVSAEGKAAAAKKLAALKAQAGVGDDSEDDKSFWGDPTLPLTAVGVAGDGDDYMGDWATPKFDPDDPRVSYDPLGGDKTNACANCAFFDADDAACRLVCGDIVAPGLCNLWLRELDEDEEAEQQALPVSIVGDGKEVHPNLLSTIKTALKQVLGLTDNGFTSGFKAFGPNNDYWVAFFSNNAQDRDRQWFAEKAHDRFIERLDRGEVPMPKLDYWHTKAYHGEAFWVDRIDHVMMAVGKFDSTPFAQAMKEYYANTAPDSELVSFGYFYPRSALVDDVYHDYNAFEISPLPAEAAANLWTGFANLKEFQDMTVSAEKRKELERRLGPALAQQLLAAAGSKSKQLDTIATSFKDIDNPLEAKVSLLLEAVATLAGQKAVDVSGDKPKIPTKRQGQPNDEEEADDEPAEDLDEDDDENIGRLGKEIKRLQKQVASLRRKAAAADDGEDEEDDGEDGDNEDDGEDDGKSGKARKSRRTAERGLKQLAVGYKALSEMQAKTNASLEQLANGINQLAKEIYNPQPASRSPYSVVPQSDPTLNFLAEKMQGDKGQDMPPGQNPSITPDDYAQLIGLPTAFGQNGRH